MTAEVAILNKAAVALAADSAVTISAGSEEQKIFDSADKLFELSCRNPIAAMVNANMSFMETPIGVIIKEYRKTVPRFARVRDAADHFIGHLAEFIGKSPARIEEDNILGLAANIFDGISKHATDDLLERLFDHDRKSLKPEFIDDADAIRRLVADLHDEQYKVYSRWVATLEEADFSGDGPTALTPAQRKMVRKQATNRMPAAPARTRTKAVQLVERAMRKRGLGGGATGLVIAGFGDDDLFPTLISFELYGSFAGRLKYAEIEFVDIDRDGTKAKVLPFAQREMVERFLYGLDSDIERQIIGFARSAVPSIAEQLLQLLDMNDDDRAALIEEAQRAEIAFYRGMEDTAFETIRAESRTEIEGMVEFMPKPEMARMAEALVNLTSIKRRVSRGHETVGGPIDVAMISKAEGFVWVQRKHYFPSALNNRYFDRMRAPNGQ